MVTDPGKWRPSHHEYNDDDMGRVEIGDRPSRKRLGTISFRLNPQPRHQVLRGPNQGK
jgi:hypothetical protein